MKNELRNEQSDPVVLSRKRKVAGSGENAAKLPTTRRGIINWQPPVTDGEDEHSCKSHVAWMQKEFKKRQPNMGVVAEKMKRTFSFRRKLINEGKHPLNAINAKYPFLFEFDQVYMKLVLSLDENVHEHYMLLHFGGKSTFKSLSCHIRLKLQ